MFDDISFETDDDKWKWISILSGMGIGILTTGIMIGCYCKGYIIKRKERRLSEQAKALYKRTENSQVSMSQMTPPLQPTAPPSIFSRTPSIAPPSYATNTGIAVPIQTSGQLYNIGLKTPSHNPNINPTPKRRESLSV